MIAQLRDLGTVGYEDALQIQESLVDQVINRELPSTLLLLEHPPVLTLGSNFHKENLLFSDQQYADLGINLHRIGRGGDVTFHGPGQLVAYPIFNLLETGADLHLWLRQMEEAVILCLAKFGIEGRRFPPHTGVWIVDRKVCAVGIKVRKWVSYHGLALNVDLDLAPFDLIVPCGIRDYGVTSASLEAGRPIDMADVKLALRDAFQSIFDIDWK